VSHSGVRTAFPSGALDLELKPGSAAAALVRTAARLVPERRLGDVLPGVRGSCRDSGVSAGTFYTVFADARGFHEAVLHRIAASDGAQAVARRLPEGASIAARAVRRTPEAQARLAARVTGHHVAHRADLLAADFRARLLVVGSLGNDPDLDGTAVGVFRRLHAALDGLYAVVLQELLDTAGWVPRPPFTTGTLAIGLTAMADGLLLRRIVDPGIEVVTLFEDLVTSCLSTATCRADEVADLDDFVAAAS
jgi:hypothetical protein